MKLIELQLSMRAFSLIPFIETLVIDFWRQSGMADTNARVLVEATGEVELRRDLDLHTL